MTRTRAQANAPPEPIIPNLAPPNVGADPEDPVDPADVDDPEDPADPVDADQPADPADAANPLPPPAGMDPQLAMFAQVIAQALGQVITQVNANQTAPPDTPRYPKAKDPSMFNGRNRKTLRTWIGENEICFRTAPNLYRTDVSKVMFAGSFLEGDAKTWFTDYFKDPNNTPIFMEHWAVEEVVLELWRLVSLGRLFLYSQ